MLPQKFFGGINPTWPRSPMLELSTTEAMLCQHIIYLEDTTQHVSVAYTGTVILARMLSPQCTDIFIQEGSDGTQSSGTCRPSRGLPEPGKDTTKS